MHATIIHAWLQDVHVAGLADPATPSSPPPPSASKRPSPPKSKVQRQALQEIESASSIQRCNQRPMTSPPKRKRTIDKSNTDFSIFDDLENTPRQSSLVSGVATFGSGNDEHDLQFTTPTRTTTLIQARTRVTTTDGSSLAGASSAFVAALATRRRGNAPSSRGLRQQRSRSTSPSKQYQTTSSLVNLARPVRFKKETDLAAALPEDARRLYYALVEVENKEGILPIGLRETTELKGPEIRPFMWQTADCNAQQAHGGRCSGTSAPAATSQQNVIDTHQRILTLRNKSITSSNLHRSESAWNTIVHYPVLSELTNPFPFIDVEPITSAQIAPDFRPFLTITDDGATTTSSISGASYGSSNVSSSRDSGAAVRAIAPSSSIHKMVDLALVLCPDPSLEALIERFLSLQPLPCATINQTSYEPLRSRPAPVFIETKSSSGSIESANVQLGVWIAAWHERFLRIIGDAHVAAKTKRVITLPAVVVMGGVWSLLFVVDCDSEIHVLDRDLRIGDTNSIVGMYQLQAAIRALVSWMNMEFRDWVMAVLQDALGTS